MKAVREADFYAEQSGTLYTLITTLGTLIAVAWPVGLAACATWLLVAAVFRISSLAALLALAASPLFSSRSVSSSS